MDRNGGQHVDAGHNERYTRVMAYKFPNEITAIELTNYIDEF